ncbi:MAG TPA: murein biosynthesis integral membrane protein MurJ [Chloroflexota bacterium]|nr:murein biosynthesis integral membrane protein MurJ [Chloroflexota bacterium]
MRRVAGAAAIIFLGNVASRVLGLVRELVIAALFGATGATSAYRTAAQLATQAYDLLISGAISAALVPVFTDYADAPDRRAFARVVSVVLNLLLLALAVLLLALGLAAPWLVRLLGADPAYLALTVTLTRWALLSVFFLGVAGVVTAACYARRDFKWPALATAAYNLGIIAAALGLTRLWPPGDASIVALAIGLVLGALLQAAVQLPGLRDVRYQPLLDWRHPGVRRALRLYAPVVAGLVVTNVGVGWYLFLAWQAGPDVLATLGFATNLVQFPLGLVASAVSLAALPTLARAAGGPTPPASLPIREGGGDGPTPPAPFPAREGGVAASAASAPPFLGREGGPGGLGPEADYAATLTFAMRLVLLLILPATAGLVALRVPAVALLFQRGAFDALATQRTAEAFAYFSPQLPFAALDQLFIVAFYARKDTRTPVLVGVGTVLLYILTAPVLCGCVGPAPFSPLGGNGLALANALQNSTHAVVLYLLLRRLLPELGGGAGGFLLRVGLAALIMGLALQWALPALTARLPVALVVVVGGALGAVVYAALLGLLRVPEARLLWEEIAGRLHRD